MFKKEKVTIVITDSGLGGLSICAEIARNLKDRPIFPEVSLIYFNAWPEQDRGYNRLKNMTERIRVFNRALDGMKRFNPDFIMIACNTLSILYDQTVFSRNAQIPVIDIVRFGVDMIHNRLSTSPVEKAVILGTLTNIAARTHQSQLVARGIDEKRLIPQACDQLATEIEKGSKSSAVVALVGKYMSEAADKIGQEQPHVAAALCCTHFGYCKDLIQKELESRINGNVTILDPNLEMAAFLFAHHRGRRYSDTAIDLKVVSKIFWEETKIDTISGAIEMISAETSDALKNYAYIPDLFTF